MVAPTTAPAPAAGSLPSPAGAPAGGPVDVAIVGGGIVGLATALRLLEQRPDLRLVILERESELAMHQSGHNSGVVHAGLYYAPGSLKARLCREGKRELEAFCDQHGIPVERTGKLVVALDESELPRFEALRERAVENEVPGLEVVGPERMRELEPHAIGIRALWSPTTGIVDFRRVALAYAHEVRAKGGTIETSRPVTGIERRGDGSLVLATPRGELVAGSVIVCAGLWADQVAAFTGDAGPAAPRIIPFRGDYYTLTPAARPLVRGLIYPVPDPRFPFLGVHLTKRHDGEVWAGPNAVLAFRRTGYRRRDISREGPGRGRDLSGVPADGAPLLADRTRRDVARLVEARVPGRDPALRAGGPGGAPGVRPVRRARAGPRRGTARWSTTSTSPGPANVLHVRNAPSPAATASLAIGRELAARAIDRFGL